MSCLWLRKAPCDPQLHPLFPQREVLEMVEELLVGVIAMKRTVLDQTDLLLELWHVKAWGARYVRIRR